MVFLRSSSEWRKRRCGLGLSLIFLTPLVWCKTFYPERPTTCGQAQEGEAHLITFNYSTAFTINFILAHNIYSTANSGITINIKKKRVARNIGTMAKNECSTISVLVISEMAQQNAISNYSPCINKGRNWALNISVPYLQVPAKQSSISKYLIILPGISSTKGVEILKIRGSYPIYLKL